MEVVGAGEAALHESRLACENSRQKHKCTFKLISRQVDSIRRFWTSFQRSTTREDEVGKSVIGNPFVPDPAAEDRGFPLFGTLVMHVQRGKTCVVPGFC